MSFHFLLVGAVAIATCLPLFLDKNGVLGFQSLMKDLPEAYCAGRVGLFDAYLWLEIGLGVEVNLIVNYFELG